MKTNIQILSLFFMLFIGIYATPQKKHQHREVQLTSRYFMMNLAPTVPGLIVRNTDMSGFPM